MMVNGKGDGRIILQEATTDNDLIDVLHNAGYDFTLHHEYI